MKKTYKAPLTEVVKINTEQMICASGDQIINAFETEITEDNVSGFTPAGKDNGISKYFEGLW